jgi:hypothetical protein
MTTNCTKWPQNIRNGRKLLFGLKINHLATLLWSASIKKKGLGNEPRSFGAAHVDDSCNGGRVRL